MTGINDYGYFEKAIEKNTLIYPIPYQFYAYDGEYEFGVQADCLVSTSFKNTDALNMLKELWTNFTFGLGKLNIIKTPGIKENEFAVTNSEETLSFPDLKNEIEYAIEVNSNGVFVSGCDEKGLIHAFATLLQLIEAKNIDDGASRFVIQYCSIQDKPAMKIRGIHLCVFPETKLLFIKKFIRFSGLMKYTHIIIEFWGMLKFDVMSELSWENAYSKDQIRPLINEANALGMEVIPMFNHFGHATQSRVIYGKHVILDQNPRKALLFEPDGWTWCLSNPDTIKLLKEIRKELIELCGEGEFFHLGCDEAYSFATCRICRNSDKNELLAKYINSLAEDLKKYNRRGIIWGDALLDTTQWKAPNVATSRPDQKTHEILRKLDTSLIIDDWQYWITEEKVPTSECFMKNGFDVLLSSWDDLKNISALCKAAIKLNAFGIMETTWHTIHENILLIPYTGECAWSGEKAGGIEESDLMRTYAASLQRKLVPVQENYMDAGWNDNDT